MWCPTRQGHGSGVSEFVGDFNWNHPMTCHAGQCNYSDHHRQLGVWADSIQGRKPGENPLGADGLVGESVAQQQHLLGREGVLVPG
jgi:hypothetical protein